MSKHIAVINFGNTAASQAKPAVISSILFELLSKQDLWAEIEEYLLPPGICGSKAFDQANVVVKIRQYDESHDKKLAWVGLTDRILWNYIYRELGKVLQTRDGRVLGLLEDKTQTQAAVENGNGADIE